MSTVYNVGAIGTAWAARSPLPTFKSFARTRLLAICSARLERARAAAEQFEAPLAYDDYREMVRHPDIDIVYVGAPVYLHAPMVLAAIEAGKHVLCEKPLALDVVEARAMLEAAERHARKHVVAFTMRHYPWSHRVKQLIDEGILGELRHVNVVQMFGFPIMPPPGAPAAAAPPPGRRGPDGAGSPPTWTWVNDASLGGGMLGAMGSHYIDLLHFWLGSGFTSLGGHLRTWQKELATETGEMKPVTADDAFAFDGVLEANGALFTMQFSSNVRAGTGSRLELYGSTGTIVVDQAQQVRRATAWDRELQPVETPEIAWPEGVGETAVPRFGWMIWKLIRAIEDPGYEAHPNLSDGLRCQEVMDAVRLSHREGRLVHLQEVRGGSGSLAMGTR